MTSGKRKLMLRSSSGKARELRREDRDLHRSEFVEGEFEATCQTLFEPLTLQRRVRINRSDPAGAAACPVPGRWQPRRHRIPAPWLGRRVDHGCRKLSCGKRRPADELRTRRRAEGRYRAVFLTRRDPLDPMPSRTGRSGISPTPRLPWPRAPPRSPLRVVRASVLLQFGLPSAKTCPVRTSNPALSTIRCITSAPLTASWACSSPSLVRPERA